MRICAILAATVVVGIVFGQYADGRRAVGNDVELGEHLEGPAPHQYAFLVSIQIDMVSGWHHICTGSIVANAAVLTTAHCATQCNDNYCRIVAGAHDLSKEESSQRFYYTNCVSVHPSFDRSDVNFDYGIIYTNAVIDFKVGEVDILDLPASSSSALGETCMSPGWDYFVPAELRHVSVKIKERETCEESYGALFKDQMICGKDAVKPLQLVEHGGPLMCQGILAGLGSWGLPPSGQVQHPAVFSNIAMELNWIKSKINDSCIVLSK